MEPLDVVQLILALWGAGLATYLGLRELKKEARQLRVFLDQMNWAERHRLVVVNVGHRPITITDVGVRLFPKDELAARAPESARPFYPDYGNEEIRPPSLPAVLGDGESRAFLMQEGLGELLGSDSFDFVAYARDAEGKEHTTSQVRVFDAKYNYYE